MGILNEKRCKRCKMKIENIYIEGLNKELTFWIGTSKEDNDNMINSLLEQTPILGVCSIKGGTLSMDNKTIDNVPPKAAQESNELLSRERVNKASENYIWVHVNNISSCHVICKIPVAFDRKEMKYIIKTGALLCKKIQTN